MLVPLYGRVIAAVAGGLLVLTVWTSAIGALIVSRSVGSRLTRMSDKCVTIVFRLVSEHVVDYRRRDRILSAQAAAILFAQLTVWLITAFVGFALLLWPFEHDMTAAFVAAGSSLFTLGFDEPPGATPAVMVFVAAATGLIIVTLLIAYLPTLYGAFNRRETEVALLNARAGVPSWGPELLARTHYALGSGRVHHRHHAGPVRPVGTLGRRRRRKPHDLPAAGAVPLAAAKVILGHRAAGRAGFRRAVPVALAQGRARGAGPAVPARRLPVLRPGRAGDGLRYSRGARPQRRDPCSPTSSSSTPCSGSKRSTSRWNAIRPTPGRISSGGASTTRLAAYAIAFALDVPAALWSGPRMHPVEPIPPFRPAARPDAEDEAPQEPPAGDRGRRRSALAWPGAARATILGP